MSQASETRYLKRLRSVVTAYVQPLQDSGVLTAAEHATIFRGMADIRDVHGVLHAAVVRCAEEDVIADGIANLTTELLRAKAALEEVYTRYVRGHSAGLAELQRVLPRPDVSRVIAGIADADERVRGVSLSDLLAVPCDHLLEWRELLSELLRQSTPSDRSYGGLVTAADLFTALSREAMAGGYVPHHHSAGLSSASPAGAGASAASIDSATPARSTFSSPSSAGAGLSSSALLAAALPPPATGASSDTPLALSAEMVISAQAEADEAARRLDALEREVALRDSELALASREVAKAEADRAGRGDAGGAGSSLPLDEAVRKLGEEERELLSRLSTSEHRALFEAFLTRKRELEEEEARLNEALEEHEDTLAKVRARLANPPASLLPADPAKAALYVAWKRALAERDELLRQARKRKHELLRDLKARHETQIVLLELERRAAVEGLRESVDAETAKVDAYKRDLAALDETIESARTAMSRFRQEFEQLRVALLIDRMAKSSQVANLADRRRRLAREAEQFQEAVDAAKARVAAEEAAKWEARLAAEREAGERRVAEEKAAIEGKIEKVRAALAERYEAGFKQIGRAHV